MTARAPLAPLVLVAAFALSLAACDYDAAYRTWCYKNHCESFPQGDGGVLYACDGCGGEGDVCVVLEGMAVCKRACTGFISGCAQGLDCKLVPAAYQVSRVPACVDSGASVEACDGSPLACAAGYTCIDDSAYTSRCVEMCTPFKGTCDSAGLQCAYGLHGFPADWGYCF